ncbi:ferrous iron transport protein B [Humidesulfovibrio mexicanus]|uniref:Ferrous iron transport protein B n=1 Tax=Humidesulfovibrio mexicanus TaxID=147047 RepID=A0A239D757_9BACT|nr:ferrous iron transport protein B [Humidesulfovibrio mexicanus]SNS28160.1 ferrous iron transport protein B [Humidesulfovibrio mexicanus]
MSRQSHLVALAGQPNCGKSTLFNMLTGARQHVANYPGVTVEKRSGRTRVGRYELELVDLPGIYGLTSYSLEERVARDFLLHDRPRAVLAVLDAANLRRGLYLVLQLLEMGLPLAVDVNMTDVAERRGTPVDAEALSRALGVPVVRSVGSRGTGAQDIRMVLAELIQRQPQSRSGHILDYGPLEEAIAPLEAAIHEEVRLRVAYSARWLAIKLLEGDEAACELLERLHTSPARVRNLCLELRAAFASGAGMDPARHVAAVRNRAARNVAAHAQMAPSAQCRTTVTERLDAVVLHRFWGPVFLVGVLLALYQAAIGVGDGLGEELRGALTSVEDWVGLALPAQGFLEDPLLRSLGIWTVQGVTAILGYLPVFLLLFGCIALLEDSGYMPRMAFLLDRLFRRFGLHGQSTLPLILGGVYLGGCAIPAIMTTRGIPDERARLTTILVAPMMNCLAKVPLHLILIGAYFADTQGLALFFISTVTLFMALPVAKALSLTAASSLPRAPFLMELPPYHLPTARAVAARALERSLLFVKKIMGVVLAVSVVVFALITFPGLDEADAQRSRKAGDAALERFLAEARALPGLEGLNQAETVRLLAFAADWRSERAAAETPAAQSVVDSRFAAKNPLWLALAAGQSPSAQGPAKALRDLAATRKALRAELRQKVFAASFLGMAGRALEPVTRAAGFDWRINIALLSAFAAKENAAMSLGAIYGLEAGEEDEPSPADLLAAEGEVMPVAGAPAAAERGVEAGMLAGSGFTPLHALSLMLFMALYPPCLPAAMTVRLASGSTRWMLFSMAFQTLLGLAVASLVYTGAKLLGLSGWQAMWAFYALCVAATLGMALLPEERRRKARATDSVRSAPALRAQ